VPGKVGGPQICAREFTEHLKRPPSAIDRLPTAGFREKTKSILAARFKKTRRRGTTASPSPTKTELRLLSLFLESFWFLS
jgi:hypothetical protein